MTAPFPKRQIAAQKYAFLSMLLDTVLMLLQITVGTLAHSQALIADGTHSFADLVSDFVILIVHRHSGAHPDSNHNYGHSRYETVASLFLGSLLIILGISMIWRCITHSTAPDKHPPVHVSALFITIVALFSKELLSRFMLREAQRVRSVMLMANAWHARSDAASSLVVTVGIIGSLLGCRWLDPIAVAVVGFIIVKMGWIFSWDAIQDLSDRAVDNQTTYQIRKVLLSTPGVQGVHQLRTRKMGDAALVDAHILVEPRISVSEGHYIAETARLRVLQEMYVRDALIHVDPENNENSLAWELLPPRDFLRKNLEREFSAFDIQFISFDIHYLQHGIELNLFLKASSSIQANSNYNLTQTLDLDDVAQRLGVYRIRLQQGVDSALCNTTR
ncbi:cation diffusion facilitator family transporter [Candidatus Vallotiella sp. (ex Adelges kitamiensis)]|uniref:cation diffusion facilitator family transporter n=1 Tax=Candidatus Vallotiella sp. (ex Adelges kitamiensis) TaxID=2864217 RepID=UPI001CE2733B|nr:cation diffusion facilitator family transporter [Candidatus Vallotia sp. (ex Adelges kitamiensis)]